MQRSSVPSARRRSRSLLLAAVAAGTAGLWASAASAQTTYTLNAEGAQNNDPLLTVYTWNTAAWSPAGFPNNIADTAVINFREFGNVDGTGDVDVDIDLGGGEFTVGTLNFNEGTGNTDPNFVNGILNVSNINYTAGGREVDFENTGTRNFGAPFDAVATNLITIRGNSGSLAVSTSGNNFDFLGPIEAATSLSFTNSTTQFMRISRTTTASLGVLTQNAGAAFVIQNFNTSAAMATFTLTGLNFTNTGKLELDRVTGSAAFGVDVNGPTNIMPFAGSRLRLDSNDDLATLNLNGLVTIDNDGDGVEIGTEDQRAIININGGIADGGQNDVLSINLHGRTNGLNDFGLLTINSTSSTRTAQTSILGGRVEVNVNNGLGTGRINVGADSALHFGTSQGALNVAVAEFGAISGNLSGVNFGTNVTLPAQNAVFLQGTTDVPNTGQTGGAVHFLGMTNNTGAGATVTVGDDGNAGTTTDIYKGVAFGAIYAIGDFGGTINEAQPGQGLLAYMAGSKRFGGASGTATFNTTGALTVNGPGLMELNEPDATGTTRAISVDTFTRDGLAGNGNATILRFQDANSFLSGQTVNVLNGRVDLDADNGVQAGAIVNIGAGATLALDRNVTTGTFRILQGGAIAVNTIAHIEQPNAVYELVGTNPLLIIDGDLAIASGSRLETLMQQMDVVLHDADADAITGVGIVLGNGKRLTTPGTSSADLTGATGVAAAVGATSVILSAADGMTLTLASPVNLPGIDLLIGDTNPFDTIVSGGTGATDFSRTTEAQTGTVRVTTPMNYGTATVRAGRLQAAAVDVFNGKTVTVNSGAAFMGNGDDASGTGLFNGANVILLNGSTLLWQNGSENDTTGGTFTASGTVTVDHYNEDDTAAQTATFGQLIVGANNTTINFTRSQGSGVQSNVFPELNVGPHNVTLDVGNNSPLTITNVFASGSGTLTLKGAGAVTIPGDTSSLAGPVIVEGGGLTLTNSFSGAGKSMLVKSSVANLNGGGTFGNLTLDGSNTAVNVAANQVLSVDHVVIQNFTTTAQPLSALSEKFYNSGATGGTLYATGTTGNDLISLEGPGNFLTFTPVSTNTLNGPLNYPSDTALNTRATASGGAVGTDNIGGVWQGTLNIPAGLAGPFTFGTQSDDGSALYIDLDGDGFELSERVVNNLGLHGAAKAIGTVNLAAGTYPIAVSYFEATGGAIIEARIGQGTIGSYDALKFLDPNGNLSGPGAINIAGGGQLLANSINGGVVNLTSTGPQTRFELNPQPTPTQSSLAELNVLGTNPAVSNIIGANSILTVVKLSISGGTMTVGGEGKLLVTGAGSGPGKLAITQQATLGGTGTIAGSVDVSGAGTNLDAVVAPGLSIGTLSVGGDVILFDHSTLAIETAAPGTNDVLAVTGNITLETLNHTLALTSTQTGTFVIATFAGYGSGDGTTNQFEFITMNNDPVASGPGQPVEIFYNPNNITVQINTVVPEPGAIGLLGIGAAALMSRRRRR